VARLKFANGMRR